MSVFIFEEMIPYGVRCYVVVAETREQAWAHLSSGDMPSHGWTVAEIPIEDGAVYETIWSE